MNNAEPFVLIDNDSIESGEAYKVTSFILSARYWHKILVTNADTEPRDLVLTTLMEAVRPHDFIPVNYKVEDDGTVTFLMKNCGQAIMQFCWMHLTIAHPEENHPPFKIKVIIREKLASQFSVCLKPNIIKILKRRYDRIKKRLNLDQFHQDPELTQFFHLSQPKLLSFILHLGRDLHIEHLKLSNNDIESLNPFEVMCNENCLKGLSGVDLSNNKIKSIEELNYLKVFSLHELSLDGNPICNEYTDQEYLKEVMKYFPKLRKLDACDINKLGVLPFRRNFMCTQSGHELIDRFLEHYFNLYDSLDRSLLEGMYHRNAMFSLTAQFLSDQISSKTTKILSYKKYGRNIKCLTDFSKSDLMMFVGNQMISDIFTALPPTEHDPKTFTVDLTKFEGSMLVLTVTGIYKHPGTSLMDSDEMYNFMRTFNLIRINDEEYKIINDLMNVSNATSSNQRAAFKEDREPIVNYIQVPVAKEKAEVQEMLESLVVLTNMKMGWAKKCLVECEYDLKKSLNLFVSLYKGDRLPPHAFNLEEANPENFTFPIEANFTPAPVKVPTLPSPSPPPTSPPPTPSPPPPPVVTVREKSVEIVETKPAVEMSDDSVQTVIKEEDVADSPQAISTDDTDGSVKSNEDKTDPPVNQDGDEETTLDKVIDDLLSRVVSTLLYSEAKTLLSEAAKRVISSQRRDVWYYGIIGSEYYKLGALHEARTFLAESKKILSAENYEKISLDFLLFEIEYGSSKKVDELIKTKILQESVDSVLEFVLKRVPTISHGKTRSLLWRMAQYNVLLPGLKKIVNACKKFELVYGTAEKLERVLKLENEYFGPKTKPKPAPARAPSCASMISSCSDFSRHSRSPDKQPKRSRSPHKTSRRSPHKTSRRSHSPAKISRRSRSRSPHKTSRRSAVKISRRSLSPLKISRRSRSPHKTSRRSRSPHKTSRRSRSPRRSHSPHKTSRRSRSRSHSPHRPPRRRTRSRSRRSKSVQRRRSHSPKSTSRRSCSPAPTSNSKKPARRSNSENEKRTPAAIIRKAARIIRKGTKLTKPAAQNGIKNAVVELIEISPERTPAMTFEEFRSEIIRPIGVHVHKIADFDVTKLEEFTGSNTQLIYMCEAALKSCQNRFSVVSIIYKKYWQWNMVSSIRDLLARAKDFPEKGLVNNLIVLFKIRMQLQQRNESDTLQKIHTHLNKIPFKDVINFFESLSNESGAHVNVIFESCLRNEHINETLKRVIILKYKAFCNNTGKFEKFQNSSQFAFYLNAFNHMLFNLDETISSITQAGAPFTIPATATPVQVQKIVNIYLLRNNYAVEKCAQVVWFLHQKYRSEAQTVLDFCMNLFESEVAHGKNNKAFQLSLIITVLAAGVMKRCPVNRLQRWKPAFDLNANLVCTIAEIYLIRKNFPRAKLELISYINDPIILDTDVQKCLFQYFESWKWKYNVDMLTLLLRYPVMGTLNSNAGVNQTKKTNLKNKLECVEVLISSDEDESK